MKTAGVVFDFYDDPSGRVLKEAFPTANDLPDMVKSAHILNPEEREVLRDEAYALVMHNEGKILRKFACVDAGNTLLSATYFAEAIDVLPDEAVKVAAANLDAACTKFGLNIPFLKEAATRSREDFHAWEEEVYSSKEKTAAVMAAGLEKLAREQKGDNSSRLEDNGPDDKSEKPRGRASGMSRTRDSMRQPIVGDEADWAQRTNLISVRGGADSGRVIPTASQMKTAMVDVSGKEAPSQVFKKTASLHALGDKYPLDSYADIRAAVDYFKQSWTEFDPQERHEFCVKTASVAQKIGLEVPDLMMRYGSEEYAPDVDAHIANRKANSDPKYHEVYDALVEKRAEIDPEHFAGLLTQADVTAGLNWYWGGAISDPYLATFGGNTDKEKVAFSWEGSGYQVDQEQLQNLAGNQELLMSAFDKDIVYAFQKDPVTIFESLPDDSKAIFARLATGG